MLPRNVLIVAFYQCFAIHLNAQIETFKPNEKLKERYEQG